MSVTTFRFKQLFQTLSDITIMLLCILICLVNRHTLLYFRIILS